MSLLAIQNTVQQAATAITAALELETEIVDENLMIIGGTGRFYDKIGQFEENGDLDSDLVYATCLRDNHEYVNFNPSADPKYEPKENEKGELCCPIRLGNRAIGLIGLIALTDVQRELLVSKVNELTIFLRSMAELISGKYEAELINGQLKEKIESLLPAENSTSFDGIIGSSNAMTKVKKRAHLISVNDSTVLITGESGTGKDLLARAIHANSPRKNKPFISVNCAAIPDALLESELFGYVGGAFTGAEKTGKSGKFQLAEGGTIFLDEIGDMPLHLQAKLLTALQNHQIDPIGATAPIDINVRVIAATNKNLEEMIEAKQFREDLYFRLNVIPINIPPLRERPEDIELLLNYAIEKFASKFNKPVLFLNPLAKAILLAYKWPGNVRELENVIEYAINMTSSNIILPEDLPDRVTENTPEDLSEKKTFPKPIVNLKQHLALAEYEMLTNAVDVFGWTLRGKRQAAEALGISESSLYRKLRTLAPSDEK